MKKILSIILLALIPLVTFASDRIEYEELPKMVKQAFDKAFGKDQFEFEKIYKKKKAGVVYFKIRGEYDDDEYDITVTDKATILKIDRESEEEDEQEDKERD
jgi:hypothetical protein